MIDRYSLAQTRQVGSNHTLPWWYLWCHMLYLYTYNSTIYQKEISIVSVMPMIWSRFLSFIRSEKVNTMKYFIGSWNACNQSGINLKVKWDAVKRVLCFPPWKGHEISHCWMIWSYLNPDMGLTEDHLKEHPPTIYFLNFQLQCSHTKTSIYGNIL